MPVKSKILNFFKKSEENENDPSDYICKFVLLDGEKIGESIALYGDCLLVKHGPDIFGVPMDSVIAVSEEIVIGKFNKKEAIKIGKKWKDRCNEDIKDDEI
ncbi:MAG: hypothetical protein GKB99_03630 [Methanocellales archaeon]|nr:hypothetical protein [Methanocellales archaeon]